MVGGTLENKDRLRGGAWTWTSAVLIAQALVSFLSVAPPDPGTFSLSPSENDSKFSPTNEGVFEQTEEPEKKVIVIILRCENCPSIWAKSLHPESRQIQKYALCFLHLVQIKLAGNTSI